MHKLFVSDPLHIIEHRHFEKVFHLQKGGDALGPLDGHEEELGRRLVDVLGREQELPVVKLVAAASVDFENQFRPIFLQKI
jgi:hypothetical protein